MKSCLSMIAFEEEGRFFRPSSPNAVTRLRGALAAYGLGGLAKHEAPGSRSITAASPDDYPDLAPPEKGAWGRVIYEPCPACGLERLVYVTHMLGEPASPDRH
jgi:hypothetical protein